MEELKIVIEKKSKGINCDITGKNIDNETVASILLKSFINFCKATEVDIENLLDELSKD